MKHLTALLLTALLAACSMFGQKADAVMCGVATDLVAARGVAQRASLADAAENKNEAQALAAGAKATAQEAYDRLRGITDEDVTSRQPWLALSDAYLHVGQAANALLPGFENTHGITDSELAEAGIALRVAEAELPERCFAATPAPSAGGAM